MRNYSLIDAPISPDGLRAEYSPVSTGFHGETEWSIRFHRLNNGRSEGIDLLEVDNSLVSITIIPTRGMGLWQMMVKQEGHAPLRLGWNSPANGPVHPKFVDLHDRNGLGWLTGFDELLVRCGLVSNGPPGNDEPAGPIESQLTLHGRIANLPAHQLEVQLVEDPEPAIQIVGAVREQCLFGQQLELQTTYTLPLNSRQLQVTDKVVNLGSAAAEMQMLYHINIGGDWIDKGSEIIAPAKIVAPRDERAAEGIETYAQVFGPTPGYAEQVYFYDLIANAENQSNVLLHHHSGERAVKLSIDQSTLPHFVCWKNCQSEADGYCVGLEPSTNFPNFKAYERSQGRVVSIEPGSSWTGQLKLEPLIDSVHVSEAVQELRELQSSNGEPEIHNTPKAGWGV